MQICKPCLRSSLDPRTRPQLQAGRTERCAVLLRGSTALAAIVSACPASVWLDCGLVCIGQARMADVHLLISGLGWICISAQALCGDGSWLALRTTAR